MPTQKYRKKPVVIEAWQLSDVYDPGLHAWLQDGGCAYEVSDKAQPPCLSIGTLEGYMRADLGDWIIHGVEGEFYPCKSSIFEQTYEAA